MRGGFRFSFRFRFSFSLKTRPLEMDLRSVSVAMAYLIDRRGYSLIRSFELLKSTRKQASPNAGFMKQLALWEKAKLGVKTCSLDLEKYKNDRFASAAEVAMSNEESEDDANHVCSVELR